ncbi:hypothetical protein [Chamaesiphon sp.]|uniref:hypothetical protein n=1 Tax=Chamaesiphon sp. TaxID=2814140 RepID=UPI0035945AF9
MELKSHGETMGIINAKNIADLFVPISPIDRQKRIAAILDKAEELRRLRRQSIEHLDVLTRSIFIEMFGDPVRNPKEWIKMPFSEVCSTRLGKMLDKQKQTGEYRRMYLRNANVQWFNFNLSDVFEMNFNKSPTSRIPYPSRYPVRILTTPSLSG